MRKIHKQFRQLPNGYLMAPQRGIPPEPPEGYERAAGEPFMFLPILPECSYREMRAIHRECCGTVTKILCNDRNEFVTRLDCKECPVPNP